MKRSRHIIYVLKETADSLLSHNGKIDDVNTEQLFVITRKSTLNELCLVTYITI